MAQHNMNNRAVRRIMREIKEFANDESASYTAAPLEDDLFEWHFTIRGPRDSEFEGGIYHGRIILPTDYPMKPPDIVMLTPNGRFKVGEKICLTISGFHPEHWQPAWSIRTALVAIISFMPTPANGALGAVDQPEDVRRELAAKSHAWSCQRCGSCNATALPAEELLPKAETEKESEAETGAEAEATTEGTTAAEAMTEAERGTAEAAAEAQEGQRGNAPQLRNGGAAPAAEAAAAPPPALAQQWQAPAQPPLREQLAQGMQLPPLPGIAGAPAFRHGVPQGFPQGFAMPNGLVPGGVPGRRRRVVRAQVRVPLGSFDLLISVLVVLIAALLLRKFYFAPDATGL